MPQERDLGDARCGKCKTPLLSAKPIEADARMFERQIQRSDLPVLVDVWAPWCGPCRMMAPQFESAAAELEPKFRLIKLNSDAHPDLASQLGIRGIPTLLLFAGGKEIARASGAMGKEQIKDWARTQLAQAPN